MIKLRLAPLSYLLALVPALAFYAGIAAVRADQSTPPMIEVQDVDTSNKVAVVVAPDALKKALAASEKAGQDNWLAINFVAGNPMALRVEAFPFTGKNIKVGVEALVGEQAGSAAGGLGVRLQIRLAGNAHDAFYVSPGVDVYLSPPTTAGLGHYESIYYVASDVDVSWLHQFTRHFGLELGVKAGGEVALNAPAWLSTGHTAVLPELAIFAGFRF
jgi:hypothetical protein